MPKVGMEAERRRSLIDATVMQYTNADTAT